MRIAVGVEYDGTDFFGWQRQRQTPTIQQRVEAALSSVADHPVTIHCAGRTDSGVHASGQVIHFDTTAARSTRSWVLGGNTNLPNDIALRWARPVDDTFDARRSARSRRYRYVIVNRWIRPAIQSRYLTWVHHPLDAEQMQVGAQALIGEHDFTSFRSIHCQATHARRCLFEVRVQRRSDQVCIDVHGNAFLHHMVRNIAGTLIEVGLGRRSATWVSEVLAARDRTVAGKTAPAAGLCLVEVAYPSEFGLPQHPWPEFYQDSA